MRIIISVFLLFLFSASLAAEDDPEIPLITVTGTSELNIVPDEIKISVDIDNREKLLQTAKEKTDEQARKLVALAKAQQIPPADILTSYVAMTPIRNFRKNEGRTILYFQASQRITITLHDFSKYDSLMDSMVKEGFGDATVVYDVSDMPSYRRKARISAILAAQEKARLLAEAIGQKIGKAYAIKEAAQSNPYGASRNVSLNTESRFGSQDEYPEGSSLSIGNIKVQVSVEVSFHLE